MNKLFLNNKYTGWYYHIIEKHVILDESTRGEIHHIIPSSLGGLDTVDNLVKISPRVHFICHWLLTRMTVEENRVSMIRAFWMMRAQNKNQIRYINSRAYEILKNEYSLIQSERVSGENNPMAGDKFYRSEEGEARRQLVMTGDTNPAKRPEVGRAISKSKTGKSRESFSDEWRKNLSKSNSGSGNGMHGKNHKESTLVIMREKASQRRYSEATNDRRRAASYGRKEITDGTTYKKVKLDELQEWLDKGWIVKGKSRKKKVIA